MSPINFDILQADYPDFCEVWSALKGWFDKNRRKQYVELSVLLRSLPNIEKLDLIIAISTMIEYGMLKATFRVKAPGGYLLEGDFDEPDKIPKELPDRDYGRFIPRSESDIVSGYRWELPGAA